jgi:hypothetical protein
MKCKVKPKAFITKINIILPGYKPCQVVKNHRRFRDVTALMMSTEIFPEMPEILTNCHDLPPESFISVKWKLHKQPALREA